MRIGVRNINPALLGIAWRNDIALRITRWHAGGPQQDGDCRGKMHTVALFVFEEEVFYEIPSGRRPARGKRIGALRLNLSDDGGGQLLSGFKIFRQQAVLFQIAPQHRIEFHGQLGIPAVNKISILLKRLREF